MTLRTSGERIKQTTDLILRRLEKLCGQVVGPTEIKSTENGPASASRRNHELNGP